MSRMSYAVLLLACLTIVATSGCQSPYRADRGALFGGLLGAGTGAIIGDAVGNAGAGAAIGAGVGALTGAAVGSELDQIDAQNRAAIEAKLGRQIAAGAVTTGDVITMTQAGVDDDLIVNHVRTHGVANAPSTDDIIMLTQQGVSSRVIKAMQEPPVRQSTQPVVVQETIGPPVIVHEYQPAVVVPAPYPPRRHYHYRHAPEPRVSWGFSVTK